MHKALVAEGAYQDTTGRENIPKTEPLNRGSFHYDALQQSLSTKRASIKWVALDFETWVFG
jgi:hypothetical protein